MAEDTFSNKERAALLGLMAEAREVPNPQLRDRIGFALDGRERRRLRDLKLVSSRRVGRCYVHELTDEGWKWCENELTAERPARSTPLGGACYAVLANLQRFLDRAGLRIADVFRQADDVITVAEASPPAAAEAPTADLETRVRAAYRRLAEGPGAWVSLTDLRPLLGAAPRDEVDAALRRLNRTPQANIIPESNQKVLSPADREAAVRLGGEDKHLISIEDV